MRKCDLVDLKITSIGVLKNLKFGIWELCNTVSVCCKEMGQGNRSVMELL
jgi:hypothetical protein